MHRVAMLLLYLLITGSYALVTNPATFVGSRPPLPKGFPGSVPAYMRSNVNNQFGTAPDGGFFDGPLLGPIPAADRGRIYPGVAHQSSNHQSKRNDQSTVQTKAHLEPLSDFSENVEPLGSTHFNSSGDYTDDQYDRLHVRLDQVIQDSKISSRQSDSYWLDNVAHGVMPLAPSNYTFFRNVKSYGAVGDGKTDDTVAINKAVSDGTRCGANCGSTTVFGALVYFPPGTYVVSSPIVQQYYTQFVGDPISPPTLQSTYNFTGIAIIDSDVYIPGGNGKEYYLNQNQFYRQVRNINFDLTQQAAYNTQNYQVYVPTGIHWQVGQATSITNCNFKMSVSTSQQTATGVGIMMENGSGGFMSDLTFFGGNAGIVAGSQQFTMRNMQFTSCLQAVSMIWNWGMTWQNIYVLSCYIAFNCTAHGGSTGQGTGSLSIIDSHFNGVPYAITVSSTGTVPNIVIDNLLVESSASIVLVNGGKTIFAGTSGQVTVESWTMGGAYLDEYGNRTYLTGYINPTPVKPPSLLDSTGRYFTQPKPLYTTVAGSSVVVATANGVSNKMTGDQSSAINTLLANHIGKVVFFPAGIYLVQNTVFVPAGSIIVGEGWSQIMATGTYFQNQNSPQVMVRVGKTGDIGSVQIQDMLFTVQGQTAGCILMEWNIAQSTQGSAAMWDSHFRVGGAAGSNLQLGNCQNAAPSSGCNAAAMLLHLTPKSSGYFENIWAWVADHDLDNPANANAYETVAGVPQNVETDISVYAGRGILIESQGPTWFWGTSSEHSELYNYQLSGASNIFLGHLQTETPYYQPEQNINLLAYTPGQGGFPNDPTFKDCSAANCISSWAFRTLNSSFVYVYSAGFYSFFNNFHLGCGNSQTCQERIVETDYTGEFYLYNLFTYGATELISPAGNYPPPIFFNDSNQNGYTSEVAAWLALAGIDGESIGVNDTGSGTVYVDPTIWAEPPASKTIQCYPPCTVVFPPITLKTPTTISIPPWTTSIEVGWTTTGKTTTVKSGSTITITTVYYTSITQSTTITIPPVTTTVISIWNTGIPANVTSTIIYPTSSILPPPIVITDNPNPLQQSGVSHPKQTRTIYPPPYPYITTSNSHDSNLPSVTYSSGAPSPTCHAGCGSSCDYWCIPCNPLLPFLLGGCWPTAFCLFACPPGTFPGDDGGWDPNDPNGPDGDDDCETITTTQCSTHCITASCTTSCSLVEGCDPSVTDIASTITPAGYWFGTFEPWTYGSYPAASSTAAANSGESRLSSVGLAFPNGPYATSLSVRKFTGQSFSGSFSYGPSVTAPPSKATSYITVTKTLTSTITYNNIAGYLSIAGVVFTAVVGKGEARIVSNYDLNFYSPRTTVNVCAGGFGFVYGGGTPKPANWYDIPQSVSFYSTITSYATPLSSCSYTNSAAPNNGDGGSLMCANTAFSCAIATDSTFSCDPNAFNYATYIKPLINCPVYASTTSLYTYTTTFTTPAS